MTQFFRQHHRIIFYSTWFILGLLQSAFTELQDDEAYYWVYGQYLDWGYFDHPPMIGLLIKLGYSIFPNELGVRLFPFLLNVFSLVIIEKLIAGDHSRLEARQAFLFYLVSLSIAVLQVSGFAAVPDIPLIFFTALFFLCYRSFIAKTTIFNILMLSLAIALLFYSKYHAVLIVGFTLLSNINLFKRHPIYVAGVLALVICIPHLWWQYQHNWVSFRYHLFESNVNRYKFSFTIEYIIGQLLLPGPLAGFIILPAAFLYKPRNETEKALRFTMIGIYAFFLLSSFRGRVEANWTSPVLVSLVVLAHRFLDIHARWQRLLYRLLPITLFIVLFARIVLIFDILPLKAVRERYHSWKKWPQEMNKITGGLPVIFSNSYQRASKYWFYTGQETLSQNDYRQRRNNYNFWPVEDSILGKPGWFLDIYRLHRFPDSLKTPLGWVGFIKDSSLASFSKIQIGVLNEPLRIPAGGSLELTCQFEIPEHYRDYIKNQVSLSDTTRIGIFNSRGWVKDIYTDIKLFDMVRQPTTRLHIQPGLQGGEYFLRFAIHTGFYNPTHNSEKIPLRIE